MISIPLAGEPFAGDPRGNLKKALRHMEEVGYKSFNLGPEPEFFLFKLDEQGNPTLEVNDKGGYFDLAQLTLQITHVVKSLMC